MKTLLHALKVVLWILGLFFGITFIVYMFNLDMKAASKLKLMLDQIYDRRQRDRRM